jgi:NAD(P)H-flavin reductase
MRSFPVRSIRRATPTTRILRLAADASFEFWPGQAVMLGLHEGAARRRPYSIACAPTDTARLGFIEFLIRTAEDGSLGPHLAGAGRGALIDVEGPFGSFGFPEEAIERPLFFVAGGTGIAPIRAMVRQALTWRGHAPMSLLYTARTSNELAYERELRELQRSKRIKLILTVTRDAPPTWFGRRGRLDEAVIGELLPGRDTLCFVCGPPALVQDVPRLLSAAGAQDTLVKVQQWPAPPTI